LTLLSEEESVTEEDGLDGWDKSYRKRVRSGKLRKKAK